MTSIWTERQAPADEHSQDIVAALAAAARDKKHPASFTPGNGYPVTVVDETATRVPVTLEGKHGSGKTARWQQSLQAGIDMMGGVAIPDGVRTQNTRDQAAIIVQGDYLAEFWRLEHRDGHWFAQWGGITDHYSTFSGFFDADALPGFSNVGLPWGFRASSAAALPGLIRASEVQAGAVEHAVGIMIPTRLRAPGFVWPALRTDAQADAPGVVEYGSWFDLDPNFDVDTISDPVARVIAAALQQYGGIVVDAVPGRVTLTMDFDRDVWPQLLPAPADRDRMMQAIPWEHLILRPLGKGL